MAITTEGTQGANHLTPYALTRRPQAKDEGGKRRNKRQGTPAYRLQTKNFNTDQKKIISPINPDDADSALRKIEQEFQNDPHAACESQTANPEAVRETLRG